MLYQAYKLLKHMGDAAYKESIAIFFEKDEYRTVDTLPQYYMELIPIIIMDLYDSMTHNPVPGNLHIIRYTQSPCLQVTEIDNKPIFRWANKPVDTVQNSGKMPMTTKKLFNGTYPDMDEYVDE